MARRIRHRGGRHPVLAGIAAWAAGCVLCWLAFALVSAATPTSTPDWLVFLLGYLPLWLLTALLLRGTRTGRDARGRDTRSSPAPAEGPQLVVPGFWSAATLGGRSGRGVCGAA